MAIIRTAEEAIRKAKRYIQTRDDADRGASEVDDMAIAEMYDILRECALCANPSLAGRIRQLIAD